MMGSAGSGHPDLRIVYALILTLVVVIAGLGTSVVYLYQHLPENTGVSNGVGSCPSLNVTLGFLCLGQVTANQCTWSIMYDSSGQHIKGEFDGGNTVGQSYVRGQVVFQSTNFTSVWSSVINSINGAGGRVCIGQGVFKTSTGQLAGAQIIPTAPWNNLEVEGVSAGSSIIQLSAGVNHSIFSWTGAVSNFTMSRITMDGNMNAETDYATALFQLDNPSNYGLYFTYDVCRNARNSACMEVNGEAQFYAFDTWAHNGLIGGTGQPDGLVFDSSSNQVWVTNSFFNDNQGAGVSILHCFYCTFVNNGFDNNARATTGSTAVVDARADFTALSSFEWSTVASNSFFHDSGSTGGILWVKGGAYNSITGNSLQPYTNLNTADIVRLGGTQVTFTGNSIAEIGSATTCSACSYLLVDSSCTCVVADNVFAPQQSQDVVKLLAARGTIINSNSFAGAGALGTAIEFAGAPTQNTTITNNVFTNAPFSPTIKFSSRPAQMTIIRNNLGYNNLESMATPFDPFDNFASPWGSSPTPTVGVTYTVEGVDEYLTSTSSVTISCNGNSLVSAAPVNNLLVMIGCQETWTVTNTGVTVTGL